MHVFIDTNILLTFFHFTDEDLDSLHSVFATHEHGSATVHLTSQIKDEFRRNREGKIKDALKRFEQAKFKTQFPSFMKSYDEYNLIKKLEVELLKHKNSILQKVGEDIVEHKLVADKLLIDIFEKSEFKNTSNEIFESAQRRMLIGNPPGKNQSIGDAINWLILLKHVPKGKDIHIISSDGDFYSAIDDSRVHPFLQEEWREEKKSEVYVYRMLSKFLSEHFDGVAFSYDDGKIELIEDLADSASFSQTHAVISKLETHGYFSLKEVEKILDAANANSQVGWIVTDYDVSDFLHRVAVPRRNELTNPDHFRVIDEVSSEQAERESE